MGDRGRLLRSRYKDILYGFFQHSKSPVTKSNNAPGDCLRTLDRIVGGTSSKIGPAQVKKIYDPCSHRKQLYIRVYS